MAHFYWNWVFNISYAAWIGMEIWIFSRDRQARSGKSADRGSLWLLIVVFAVGITAAFFSRFQFKAANFTGHPIQIFLLGIVLIWAGIAFRLWAVLTLGKFFRTTVMLQDSHQLVVTGPYKFLRHPSYTGGLVTFLGIGFALGNWVSLVLMLVTPLVGYGYRIHVEEKALIGHFGPAYQHFANTRWRIIPLLY